MDITYDYYRIFYYVAKYKSFTRAATILINNQPNITRSMNNLERQLGCSLFIRSNRGVELTPEGQKLYEHVAIAFEQLQAAELELVSGNSLQSGTVTMSASETALHGILLPALKSFHNAYPGIRIRISNHSTSQAVQAVKNGLVDFAVVTTPTDVHRPLKEIRLKDFHEMLVCGHRYSFLAKQEQHLAGLQDYPLITLGKETRTYEFYNSFYLEHGLAMSPDIEVATADQLLPTILHDLGIGFVPDAFVKSYAGSEKLYVIPLAEKVPVRSICLVEDKSRPLGVAANTLKNMLKECSGTIK